MQDLTPQAFPPRQHAFVEPVERARYERPSVRIGDLVEQRAQARRGAEVPEQLPPGCGMEERTERQAEAGVDGRDLAHGGVGELRSGLAAVTPLEQAHMVAVERRPWRERPGDRQVRVDRRDVRDRGLLQVDDGRVLVAVRDLEDCAAAAVVQEERLVALAAECGRGAVDAEYVRCDPRSLLGGEPRRSRVEDGGHAGRWYLASGPSRGLWS